MQEKRKCIKSNEEMPELLAKDIIRTKDELNATILYESKKLLESIRKSNHYTVRFMLVMESLLDRFQRQVDEAILPERLEDWWGYTYEITYKGAMLCLEHISEVCIDEDGESIASYMSNAVYPLIFIRTKMLTVDEYARLYEIEPVTVRQWIRRCKLRSVEKAGKEWRISELTDVPRRGFEPAQYRWREVLENLPIGFEYMNDYKLCTIVQSEANKNLYNVLFSDMGGIDSKCIAYEIDEKEHETLEAFLIGNPKVTYTGTSWSYMAKRDVDRTQEA